jgi:tripeptidyl-peptidase I
LYPGSTVNDSESAASDLDFYFASGGGFSNLYPIPQYQQNAVAGFFEKHDPPYPYYSTLVNDTGDIQELPDVQALADSSGGIYNRFGRGIPDVSANGANIAVRILTQIYHPLLRSVP